MDIRLWVFFLDLLYHIRNVIMLLLYTIPALVVIWLVMRQFIAWRLALIQIEASRKHQQLDVIERKLKLTFITHPQVADLKELDNLLTGLFEQKQLGGSEGNLFVNAFQVAQKINGTCKVQERLTQAKGLVRQILLSGDDI